MLRGSAQQAIPSHDLRKQRSRGTGAPLRLPWLRPSPNPSPWGREGGSLWCGVCPRRRATWCGSCFAAEVAGTLRATHAGQRCARLAAAATATLTPVVRCLYSAHMGWWDRVCDGGGANIGVQVALQWAPLGEIVWRRVLEGQLLSNHAPVRSGLVRKAVRLLPCAPPPLLDGHTKRSTQALGRAAAPHPPMHAVPHRGRCLNAWQQS
eukprot:COSAG01_NODE_53_length_31352_cov_23.122452_23_plen_208_part_00